MKKAFKNFTCISAGALSYRIVRDVTKYYASKSLIYKIGSMTIGACAFILTYGIVTSVEEGVFEGIEESKKIKEESKKNNSQQKWGD